MNGIVIALIEMCRRHYALQGRFLIINLKIFGGAMRDSLGSFMLLFQTMALFFLPFIFKTSIKLLFKKSWEVFTSISYGIYGDIIKNSEIILSGPLKHKNEYNRVAILNSINILLKNIRHAKWVNKSLAFKTICLAITEGKEYSLGMMEKVERFVGTVFLIILSFITTFVFLVVVTWSGAKSFKPYLYIEIFNWLYEGLLFVLSNAPLVSLCVSLLISLIFIGEWFISRKRNRNPELTDNLQLCQIISYIYYLYDLDFYDTHDVLNKYIDNSLKKSNGIDNMEICKWGQSDILQPEYCKKYSTFIPPVAAGGYLLPYSHMKNPTRPTIVGKVRLLWLCWKDVSLIIGLALVAIYWYCQSQGFNIVDIMMKILQGF